jgi:RNA polymerase sigma factor (sigma-70 family)
MEETVGMATGPATTVLHFLRRLLTVHAADALSDGDLINRFARHLDEDAFAELLRRHGPMVLGVCRRVLVDSADAEDAFQATFLVLVRKARGLRRPASVANWLHGVAHRTALKARGAAVKRRMREREAAAMSASSTVDDLTWRDLGPVLDEEIQHLPARYRAPFVLCHLEGKTNEEAARQLGCPTGTVLSRLSRARERLRARLTKRGITLSTGALVALVSGPTVSASVPAMLAQATRQSAAAFTAGGIVAAPVLTLTEGVLHAMFAAKVKFAATVVLGTALLASAGTYGYGRLNTNAGTGEPAQADGKKATQQPLTEKVGPQTAAERDRLEAQLDVYREEWDFQRREVLEGKTTADKLAEANRRLGTAELILSKSGAERIVAIQAMIQRAKTAERIIEVRVDAGLSNKNELAIAKEDVAHAEGVLAKEGKPKGKIMELMQLRLESAKLLWRGRAEEFLAGKVVVYDLLRASQYVTKSQQEMTDSAADHLRILEGQFDRIKKVQEILEARFKAGKNSISEVTDAAYARFDAEIALERFKAKLPKDGVKGEVTKSLFEGIVVDKQP